MIGLPSGLSGYFQRGLSVIYFTNEASGHDLLALKRHSAWQNGRVHVCNHSAQTSYRFKTDLHGKEFLGQLHASSPGFDGCKVDDQALTWLLALTNIYWRPCVSSMWKPKRKSNQPKAHGWLKALV